MASSFIEFKGNGIWVRDGFVEVFQLLFFKEISNSYPDAGHWLNNYKKDIALQSLPVISGGMSMMFDEVLTDKNREETVLTLIQKIKINISSDESYLTCSNLNSLRKTVREYLVIQKVANWDNNEIEKQVNEGLYSGELNKGNYLRGFNLLYQLVGRQIHFKADSPVTYWDF